jgi:hypothetical protein
MNVVMRDMVARQRPATKSLFCHAPRVRLTNPHERAA